MNIICEPSFWDNFLANFLATILGAIVGVPLALAADRFISARKAREELKAKVAIAHERRSQLLTLLRDSVTMNLQLLLKMQKEVTPSSVLFYNVDTSLLDATASLKYEVIDNLELNRLLDAFKHSLLILHRKIELQVDMQYSTFASMTNFQSAWTDLVNATIVQIPPLIKQAEALITNVDAELNK
jgi:hypothetical protein